jgi:hypothetical protein
MEVNDSRILNYALLGLLVPLFPLYLVFLISIAIKNRIFEGDDFK